MIDRPTSVTVIAWILIVMAGIALITNSISMNNPRAKEILSKSPIPLPVQYVMNYVGLLVQLVSGIGMLCGRNWARLLYVIWGVIGYIICFLTAPMKLMLIPGFIVFLIIVFFLFRPGANEYFAGGKEVCCELVIIVASSNALSAYFCSPVVSYSCIDARQPAEAASIRGACFLSIESSANCQSLSAVLMHRSASFGSDCFNI